MPFLIGSYKPEPDFGEDAEENPNTVIKNARAAE
jgi:hypothetical protein